ncbi:MAG TPA: hypothetical protein VME41_02045 [Stellaceae bacterium]|nr:hypothetical protein [Stellaceae bacterium]
MTPPEAAGLEAPAPAPVIVPVAPPADPVPPVEETRRQRNGVGRRGRHFGPRPVDDPRSARLDIRCTPAVRAKAKAAAKAAGISVAGYVAALIDGEPGPRVHRVPSEATKLLAQLRGEMGRRGSNLNQSARALNEVAIAARDGEGRDRLAERIGDIAELLRQAIAEHRECTAAIMRGLGLRPDADHY